MLHIFFSFVLRSQSIMPLLMRSVPIHLTCCWIHRAHFSGLSLLRAQIIVRSSHGCFAGNIREAITFYNKEQIPLKELHGSCLLKMLFRPYPSG